MTTIRNIPIFSCFFSALLVILLSACGGGGSSSDSNALGAPPSSTAASAVIGASGGTLTSSDGNATLTVPAGALASDTKITMTEVSGSDIPAELQDPSVEKVYDMQPDGLQFVVPATMEVRSLGSAAPPDGVPLIGLISDSEGTLELLGPLAQTVDSNGITTSGPINHFSSLAVTYSKGLHLVVDVSPSSVPVHGDFTVTASIKQTKDSQADGTGEMTATVQKGPIHLSGTYDPPGFTIAPSVGEANEVSRTVTGTCDDIGLGTVDTNVSVVSLAGSFQVGSLQIFDAYNSHIFIRGEDSFQSVECTTSPSVPPTTVGLGLHNAPGGLTKLEQLIMLGSSFANLSGDRLAVFSGAEGYVVSDLVTGEVKRPKTITGPFYGAVPVSRSPPGPGSAAEIFSFGPSPSIDYYYPDTGDFGGFLLTFMNEITDVSNAGGTVAADEQLFVDISGVNFVSFDTTAGSYQLTSETLPASGFGNAQVSAFEVMAGGPVLVVTRNLSGNGSLYYSPRDGSAPTAVGAVGADAHRIRCAAGVCAVTSFADDALTIVLWDGANTPTIFGNVSVGDGPVDLDLIALANGNVLIGTTGFNDATWTLTEIAPDGSTVSNTTQPVDAGCINPGHLSFFEDGEGQKAVITCYGSDNYDIQDTQAFATVP